MKTREQLVDDRDKASAAWAKVYAALDKAYAASEKAYSALKEHDEAGKVVGRENH